MKVRINDDATGSGYNNSLGSWVNNFRGQVFEVVEKLKMDDTFVDEVKWITIKCRRGITEKQATIIDEKSVQTTFNDIPINVPFNFNSKGAGAVCVKLDNKNYMALENKGIIEQFKVFPIYGSYSQKVYPVINYKMEFDTCVPKVVKNQEELFIDKYRKIIIYKDGSVVLEDNSSFDYNSYTKDKSEVEKIIKWGKTDNNTGCALTRESTLKIGCQSFTIEQIRNFTSVYENFLNGVNNA